MISIHVLLTFFFFISLFIDIDLVVDPHQEVEAAATEATHDHHHHVVVVIAAIPARPLLIVAVVAEEAIPARCQEALLLAVVVGMNDRTLARGLAHTLDLGHLCVDLAHTLAPVPL